MFQCSDGNSAQDNSSLKRVAVVEDFFDIIYAMHVEMGADPGRAPKHAGQKKTYKAVSKTKQGSLLAGYSQFCLHWSLSILRMLTVKIMLFLLSVSLCPYLYHEQCCY